MIKSIKTGIILLAALLLAWLPWCYAFVFASPSWSPFTLYSCVTHGFASVDFDRENNVAGRDLQGNTYTQQQFDSILPTFYYRQLAAEGRFPSEIEGVAVESRDVERTNFMFRTSPGEINRRRPTVYQLLESMPDRIDLEPATDVFRITGEGIEFVDMETNTIDQKKSAAFTKVLRDKGFSFPARVVSGNPSTRKRYDNGYLLVDDALRVYHMKQVRGRPFVRRTDVADSLQIGQIFVTEFADRKSLGFLVDSEKRFYTLGAEDYKLHEIPVGKFGPTRENMMIIGDMFYWTVTIQGAESKRYVAVNARDYSLADEYRPEEKPQAWAEYAKYLFPFELSFTSPLDGYVKPRIAEVSFQALWLGLALGAFYALIRRRWRYRFERTAPAQSVAWVTGALAALWPAMGLGYDGGSVFAFGESLRETDAEYAGAVCDLAALNGEARFSSHTMTREQAKRALRVWKQTVDRLQKNVPLPRRAWLKWIRCLY